MPPRPTSDSARLSTDDMLQFAQTCVWNALAGDADARTTLTDIRRELTDRNAVDRWQTIARPSVTKVSTTRTTSDTDEKNHELSAAAPR